MSANSTFANAATLCGGGVTRRKTMINKSLLALITADLRQWGARNTPCE
jgi:hypothetical protein